MPGPESERVVLAHEVTLDCALAGVADAMARERPKAFVVVKPGYQGTARLEEEILKDVKAKMS